MRLPVRSRGVLVGLAFLATSPLAALVGSHATAPAGHTAVTPLAAAVARLAPPTPALHLLAPHDASVDETATPAPVPTAAPTPAPTSTPAPTPTPAPVRAVATPKPTAAPAPAPAATYSPGSIQAIIVAAAGRHGVSASWMLSIARCESGFNPRAYNPGGPYIGLFQFLPSTFHAHGGTDIYDPNQQAEITATMLAAGQAHQWSCA